MQRFPLVVLKGCVAAVIAALTIASVQAQDKVVFTLESGAHIADVPIESGTSVVFDGEGNLQVVCEKDDTKTSDACVGIEDKSTTGTPASISSFVFSAGGTIGSGGTTTSIGTTQPLSVTISWATANAASTCIASSAQNLTNWNGNMVNAVSGQQAFSLTASATANRTYSFTLTCYNADGSDPVTGSRTIVATVLQRVGGGGPGVDSCQIVKGVGAGTDPLFQPTGYTKQEVSWEDAFSYEGTPSVIYNYPDSASAPYPVGSWTLNNQSIKGKYITIPFVADELPTQYAKHKLEWYKAVSSSAFSFYAPHPANGVFITISPCEGDFRTSTNNYYPAGDETLNKFCRKFHQELNMYFGENGDCPTEAGKRYYLNVVFANPADGLSPTETSCDPNGYQYFDGRCDAMLQLR